MGMRTLPLAIDPAVVVEQQIFAGMHVRDVLVAIVGLQPRRRKALHHRLNCCCSITAFDVRFFRLPLG